MQIEIGGREREGFVEQRASGIELAGIGLSVGDSVQGFRQEGFVLRGRSQRISGLQELPRSGVVLLQGVIALRAGARRRKNKQA